MNSYKVENIAAVISYIEAHLNEKLDLDTVANAVCYSKYHLHRIHRYSWDHTSRLYPAQAADRGGKAIGVF